MRIAILVALAVMVSGCDSPKQDLLKQEWISAPKEYTCTEEKMVKVEREAEWCDKNTDYRNVYCYGAAIIRNCEKKP